MIAGRLVTTAVLVMIDRHVIHDRSEMLARLEMIGDRLHGLRVTIVHRRVKSARRESGSALRRTRARAATATTVSCTA